jgi:hypothetical protein
LNGCSGHVHAWEEELSVSGLNEGEVVEEDERRQNLVAFASEQKDLLYLQRVFMPRFLKKLLRGRDPAPAHQVTPDSPPFHRRNSTTESLCYYHYRYQHVYRKRKNQVIQEKYEAWAQLGEACEKQAKYLDELFVAVSGTDPAAAKANRYRDLVGKKDGARI